MPGFAWRFVELCGSEPALWHPDHSDGLLAATERIAATLDWPGFNASRVKPLFDKCRALYEESIRTKDGKLKLNWFKAMDAYLGPFSKDETSKCSSNIREIKESANNMEIDEDVPCDVCRSPYPEPENEMIFCDACNVCVHQTCYGVKLIPEGDWFCRPCESCTKPPCILCPNKGGAMKCTSDGQNWVHVSCALWIKEVKFGDPELMEQIIISRIPASRWKLVCSLCRQKAGACIQCVVNHCTTAFHVTCAYDKKLKMEYKDVGADAVKLLCYCRKHSKKKDNPKNRKKRASQNRSRISIPQRVQPHLQRESASEVHSSLVDSDSESLNTDSTFDDSNQSSESNSFQSTDSKSDVIDERSESYSSSSTQNSVTAETQIKRKVRCFTPELKSIFKGEEYFSREEENIQERTQLEPSIPSKMSGAWKYFTGKINGFFSSTPSNAKNKTSHDNIIISDEQNTLQEQIPSNDYLLKIQYKHSINDSHTNSTLQKKEEQQLSKEEEITRLEPIHLKLARDTFASNIISDEKVVQEKNENHSATKTLDNRILSDEHTSARMQEPIPSDGSSFEILDKHHINNIHAYSTPTISHCGKLASTMVEEITQPSSNLVTAEQEKQECKSEFQTLTDEIRPKTIEYPTSSAKNKYFSVSEINRASCSYDPLSTSQQTPQDSFITHPSKAINGLTSRDHASANEDEYRHLVASNNAESLLKRFEDKKHYCHMKRKRTNSSTNSDDASSSDREDIKRIRKKRNIDESSSNERIEHYNQFAKVITTVLKTIPPEMALTLEDKIITMCLQFHKQWRQTESKNS